MTFLNKLGFKQGRSTIQKILVGVVLPTILTSVIPVQAVDLKDVFSNNTSQQGTFLPVNQAFSVVADAQDETIHIRFDITKGHYVYKDKIKLTLPDGVTAGALTFNKPPSFVDDPAFGRVAVFEQQNVMATAKLTNNNPTVVNAPVTITWQGCAKAGLCYPPEKIKVNINLPSAAITESLADSDLDGATQQGNQQSVVDTAVSTTQVSNTADTKPNDAEQQSLMTSHSAKTETTVASDLQATSQPTQLSKANQALSTPTDQASQALGAKESNNQQRGTDDTTADTVITDNLVHNTKGQVDEDDKATALQTTSGNTSADASMAEKTQATASEQVEITDSEHTIKKSYVLNHTPNLQAALLQEQSVLNDPFGLLRHPLVALGFIFLAGLGLSFTACVLPMLPIVANIVARQGEVTTKRSIQLSASYALGVAVAYGILGAIIAYIGESVGLLGWLQNPIILLVFVAIFVVLGLYMLELVNFRLPLAMSQLLNKLSQAGNSRLGSISGSFLVGLLSALVVSPCVSAPLSGVLVAVAALGNVMLGFFALFVLGLGLTLPLVIFAGTQGKFMPKAGEWMTWIKQGFAYLMFALALLMLERVFVSPMMLLLWAAWFVAIAYWLWTWRGKLQMLTQTFAMVMALWAAALLYGASQGNTNSWQPLRGVFKTEQLDKTTVTVTSVNDLDDLLTHHPKVLVDLVADWCIECRIMEESLFVKPPKELAEWQVVKFDITDTSEQSKQILSRYQLFGPPALMYYVEGQLVTVQVGEVNRTTFEKGLTAINKMADAN